MTSARVVFTGLSTFSINLDLNNQYYVILAFVVAQ